MDEACPSISTDELTIYFTVDTGTDYWDLHMATRASKEDDFGGAISLTSDDQAPNISADGLSLYFCSTRPGGSGDYDLWVASRTSTSDPWEPAVSLGPTVNSSGMDVSPSISDDGLSLYFSSERPGSLGGFDLWVTERSTPDDPWGEPENLGSNVNSWYDDISPDISSDGLTLYFSDYGSGRPGGQGRLDIWVATRATVSDPWQLAKNLGKPVNTSDYEKAPCVSSDGLRLYFSGRRAGTHGREDIWVAMRATTADEWGEPVNLGTAVNNIVNQSSPDLSADGLTLYFASEIAGGLGGWDIYEIRPAVPACDLNGDGMVDFRDVAEVAGEWLWMADWH
jgi:Tol biopolymer transport system component